MPRGSGFLLLGLVVYAAFGWWFSSEWMERYSDTGGMRYALHNKKPNGVSLLSTDAHEFFNNINTTAVQDTTVPRDVLSTDTLGFFNYNIPDAPDSTSIPREILYVWCGVKKFEFRHYLSIQSAIRVLMADNVYFLYVTYPPVAERFPYNTWLEDLREEYPFLWLERIQNQAACDDEDSPRIEYILEKLSVNGGYYIHEDTILTPAVLRLQRLESVHGLNNEGVGFLALNRGAELTSSSPKITCVDGRTPMSQTNDSDVVCITTDNSPLQPMHIWTATDTLRELARWIYYGEPSPIYPAYSDTVLSPNIAHVVWLGGGKMDFLFYMSVMSMLHVGRVDKVYIHGEAPSGLYWDRIKDHPNITVVYRSQGVSVYGIHVAVLEHKSDVARVDILSKHGGLYMDEDAIMTRPLDRHIRAFDAVIGVDPAENPSFPLELMNGVMIGKARAPFWKHYMESMKGYRDDQWVWNSNIKPYKIKERLPRELMIEPHLQLVCYHLRCPNSSWYQPPDKPPPRIPDKELPGIPAWWADVYFYHWTGEYIVVWDITICNIIYETPAL